jgi:hypothetical protein
MPALNPGNIYPSTSLYPQAPGGFSLDSFATSTGFTTSPLNEEFRSPEGIWDHYDAYDPALRAILRNQKHIDIRDFNSADRAAPLNVLDLSKVAMSQFNGSAIQSLDDPLHVLIAGEHWSTGTNAVLATHNYWRVLQVPLVAGTVTTQSVTGPIDIKTGFADDDFISLALPSFPAVVNQPGSFIDFTSHPNGDFTVGPTVSLALNTSINTLVAGNTEFRVLRSALGASVNLEAITGIRFRILSTGVGTLSLASLRLLSKNWKFGAIDFNTRRQTLVRTVSPNANPTMTTDFSQPIAWRSADVPGEEDPKPIDFNLAIGFNTGSRQGSNNISIYGRELTEDFMQQIDLNGLAQGALVGRDQPDIGQAAFNPRFQTDLEPFKQDQLVGLSQYNMERTPDYLSASWIQFVVQWTSTNTQVSVTNTEGDGYNFNLGTALAANTDYVLVFELEDTAARAAIYPLGARGEIVYNAPVFDSTLIDDDFVYKRRKGRFGWYANLSDGDAYVESIRFRSANYAEYRSLPYESLTPVIGAELYAESSPIIDLFADFETTDPSVVVERDREVSTSGESYRVTDYGQYTSQGLRSNEFDITDFDQTEVELDVFFPSSLDQDATLELYLQNAADYLIALPRPKIFPDQWQTIRLRTPSAHLAQTGLYRLIIIQNRPVNLNWWVDKVRVYERTVSWYGRAVVDDPWAATEDDWTPFQNAFNAEYSGILFRDRQRKLQVKAVGHKQNATVSKIQFKPKYAELGRFVWPEQVLTGKKNPIAAYSTSNTGRVYTFNGFGSTDPDGQVINWYWTVSDGTVYVGPIIQHTFGQAGTYTVTLTVTDQNGLVNSTSAIQSVA